MKEGKRRGLRSSTGAGGSNTPANETDDQAQENPAEVGKGKGTVVDGAGGEDLMAVDEEEVTGEHRLDLASSTLTHPPAVRNVEEVPPPPYSSKEDPAAHADEDAEALLSYFNAPPPRNLQPLRAPLCLPQATSGPTSLFTRAYSPELINSGITMEEWLHFMYAYALSD